MSEVMESWQRIHAALAGSRQAFEDQLKDTQRVQQAVLLGILKNNALTAFGKAHQFSTISSIEAFKQKVPILRYEDCFPYLDEMANNPDAELVCFESTTGSSGDAKLIPYSIRSLEAFQQALFPWLDDLLTYRPNIKAGSAYWSISPVVREKQATPGGHPVGLSNDALYFGETIAREIGKTLAVPAEVASLNDMQEWRFQTLQDLLLAEDLSFISVWSPTFLLELMQALPKYAGRLIAGISKIDQVRARFLRPILGELNPQNIQKIWPKLDTISCWADANSASFIKNVKDLFPYVYIQGKGLLATEGVITIPLSQARFPVLSISSGFYEFMDEQGDCKLACQLQTGKQYTVLLTNESGLYRYNLGDKVRMRGFYKGAPMLTFIGRGEYSSDLCGEKMSEDFVNEVFNSCFSRSYACRFLYPQTIPQRQYVLVTENQLGKNELTQLDTCLRQNQQYDYARKLGQLGALQQQIVTGIMPRYIQWQVQHGKNLGDIKSPVLITDKDFIRSLGLPQ